MFYIFVPSSMSFNIRGKIANQRAALLYDNIGLVLFRTEGENNFVRLCSVVTLEFITLNQKTLNKNLDKVTT